MKKDKKSKRTAPAPSRETPAVEALTVGWVLTMLLTLVFDIGLLATRWYLSQVDPQPRSIAALYALTVVASVLTGAICLALTPLIRKLRRDLPPTSVTWFAVIVSLFPFVMLVVNAVRG